MQNVTFSIGNLALIEKVDARTSFFEKVLRPVGGRARDFVPYVKLLAYNRLGEAVSVNRLVDFTPAELARLMEFECKPSSKQLYRTVERLGSQHAFVLANYQRLIEGLDVVTREQMADFSSGYFEGTHSPLGALGYSRDGQPGKQQITFGVSVGVNGVPTALTIQKGNVQDKRHMWSVLRWCSKILKPGSLLVFDCGGNTKAVKERIRGLGFHYLTLKAKNRGAYAPLLREFRRNSVQKLKHGNAEYECLKVAGEETRYVFFSQKLRDDQLRKKARKFQRAIEKGDVLLKKVRRHKPLGANVCREGWIIEEGRLQKTLQQVCNPFVTGLEGYFVLESSLDTDPEEILRLYKERDKAEKLIRDLKEGAELRPFRHWSENAVKGIVLLVFLTSALVRLTQVYGQFSLAKNLKLLKKYLANLTLSVVELKNKQRLTFISNFSLELKAFFGSFLQKYVKTTLWNWV